MFLWRRAESDWGEPNEEDWIKEVGLVIESAFFLRSTPPDSPTACAAQVIYDKKVPPYSVTSNITPRGMNNVS